jgi:hypothetical protein
MEAVEGFGNIIHNLVRVNTRTGEHNKRNIPTMREDYFGIDLPVINHGRCVRSSWRLTQDRTAPQLVKFKHIPSNESFEVETDEVWVGTSLGVIICNCRD